MSLMRWRSAPADPFNALQSAVNDLFQDFGRDPFALAPLPSAKMMPTATFWPSVDLSENERNITITADIPGLEEKDVDVSLLGRTLTLKGEKRTENEEKGTNFYRCERSYGTFQRNLELPCEVDAEKVQASVRKGVLTVSLPKSEATKAASRKINVRSA